MPSPVPHSKPPAWLWDIFCKVIDNHGDLGVCWRLSCQLRDAGHQVRLWVDDASALAWMAPGALEGREAGIVVMPWPQNECSHLPPAQVWVEAFACDIPESFVHSQVVARQSQQLAPPVWLNLEYLSAEAWVPRMHGLPSPVMQGPAKGYTKWFYYPGFTTQTGGLLREADLPELQSAFLETNKHSPTDAHTISLFCYEPPALAELLTLLNTNTPPGLLKVCAGRPTQAVQAAMATQPQRANPLQWTALPYMPQPQFDELLWSCHLNFVRGEDSLVRALWAGQPLVWQIYPQDDNAHIAKLDAFLDWLQAPHSLRAFHHRYNGLPTALAQIPLAWPNHDTLNAWRIGVQAARQRLLAQPSMVEQLVSFVAKKL